MNHNTFPKRWRNTLVLAAFIGLSWAPMCGAAADVSIATTLADTRVPKGGRLDVTARAEWKPSGESEIVLLQITPPSSNLLELTNTREESASRLVGSEVISSRTVRYTFAAKEVGSGTLSPVSAEYVYTQDFETKHTALSNEIDFTIIPLWSYLVRWALIIVAALVSLGLLAGIGYWAQGKIKPHRETGKKIASPSGALEADTLDRLKAIRQHQISGDTSRLYAELSNVVRAYTRDRFNVTLEEGRKMSVDSAQTHDMPDEFIAVCDETIRMSEKVRFGGLVPPKEEQEKIFRIVERYLKNEIAKQHKDDEVGTVD